MVHSVGRIIKELERGLPARGDIPFEADPPFCLPESHRVISDRMHQFMHDPGGRSLERYDLPMVQQFVVKAFDLNQPAVAFDHG